MNNTQRCPYCQLPGQTHADWSCCAHALIVEVDGLESQLLVVRESLRKFATETAASAKCLEGEIQRGVALRQSIESKQARVDILRMHERSVLDILRIGLRHDRGKP